MGDEYIGQVELLAQIGEQIDDLGLDRNVERRDRLVGHDQPWPERQRASNADTLALAAREFVGIARRVLGRLFDPAQKLGYAVGHLRCREALMDAERIGQQIADPPMWVERGARILKDHLHLSPQRTQLTLGRVGNVAALELQRTGGDIGQTHQASAKGGFTATGLADDAKRFPRPDVE